MKAKYLWLLLRLPNDAPYLPCLSSLPASSSCSFFRSLFPLFCGAAASRQPILHGTSANSAATCFAVGCQLLSFVCSFWPLAAFWHPGRQAAQLMAPVHFPPLRSSFCLGCHRSRLQYQLFEKLAGNKPEYGDLPIAADCRHVLGRRMKEGKKKKGNKDPP